MTSINSDEDVPLLSSEDHTSPFGDRVSHTHHERSGFLWWVNYVSRWFMGRGRKKDKEDYESLDYDICYNIPYKDRLKKYSKKTYIQMEVMRWVLVCVIGVLTGLVAFIIDITVKKLFSLKYGVLETVMDRTMDEGKMAVGFLVLLSFNILFALVAALLIAYEPVAAGSGIPEIKCYLNGVKVPHVTRIGTLIAKAVGVLFSVAGGFLVGKEGPMIHSGAIIGAGVPQFRSLVVKWFKFPYHYFRSDRDKRDFVSSGAAAGVAAAFGSPIGGVLFSLEEGSSFWNQSLTWKTLFCCFSATFTLNFLISVIDGDKIGFLASPGLVDFGIFDEDKDKLWNVYHLFIFILMGAVGGLLGAIFNSLNISLTKYRMKHLFRRAHSNSWRVAEVLLIILVTSFTVFIVSIFLGTCLPNKSSTLSGDSSFQPETKDFFCPGHSASAHGNKSYYNDMATLMFNPQETGIKHLFHQNGAFTLPTLLILFIIYFFIACWTYGAALPSGLFIPCLMIGAAYGRFIATTFEYLANFSPHYFSWLVSLYPGTYSLIGAASFLGGVVRMTISLTVILIESTNEIEYGLPIMLTVMVAKWVGDIFNEGIYDTHIILKKTPFLEWEITQQQHQLVAGDVISPLSNLSFVYPITRVCCIERLLCSTNHGAFLVVTPVRAGTVPSLIRDEDSSPQLYARQASVAMTTRITTPSLRRRKGWSSDAAITVKSPIFEEMRSVGGISKVSSSSSENSYDLPLHERTYDSGSMEEEDGEKEVKLVFRGLILRHQLVALLENKVFFNESDGPKSQRPLDQAALTKEYPRYPDITSVFVSQGDKNKLMDLSLYMNHSPYTISVEAPLPQVFNLFRTMGLRHLPVIQEPGLVAGIITRHDLTHEKLHGLSHATKRREEVGGASEPSDVEAL